MVSNDSKLIQSMQVLILILVIFIIVIVIFVWMKFPYVVKAVITASTCNDETFVTIRAGGGGSAWSTFEFGNCYIYCRMLHPRYLRCHEVESSVFEKDHISINL